MDITQRKYIYEREVDLIEKKRILNQLDVAESINHAYIGSQPGEKGKANKGAKAYRRWRRSKYKELNPELYQSTIWDNLKRSSRIN